jgi:ABC-type antimicrobial peptide transport system permease subunit
VWSSLEPRDAAAVSAIVAATIVLVGLAAALGPARRGLRIDPNEALRTDG